MKKNEIHPSAQIINSKIGQNVKIGANCIIENSTIENSELGQSVIVRNIHLLDSFLGDYSEIKNEPITIKCGVIR